MADDIKQDKCKGLHIESNNNHTYYSMNSTEITEVNEEKDLGVNICCDLKSGKHCLEVVKTASKLNGFIRIQIRESDSHTTQCPRASSPRILRSVLVTLL